MKCHQASSMWSVDQSFFNSKHTTHFASVCQGPRALPPAMYPSPWSISRRQKHWLVGWLVGWLGDWMVGWLGGWVVGWLVDVWLVISWWLVDWLVGSWLVGELLVAWWFDWWLAVDVWLVGFGRLINWFACDVSRGENQRVCIKDARADGWQAHIYRILHVGWSYSLDLERAWWS